MNTESTVKNCVQHVFILFFIGIFLSVPIASMAEDNLSTSPDPNLQLTADRTQPADEKEMDKFDYNQLPESEQIQVEKQADQEKQQTETETKNIRHPGSIADELTLRFREHQEMIRLFEVLILAVMSILSLAVVLWYIKSSKSCNPRDMLNGAGLVLVIFSTVLVIIIADVEVQLTAAMGVLGGIGGYLFGTMRSSRTTERQEQEPPPAQPDDKDPA